MSFYLWADDSGDARMSRKVPKNDKDGKVLGVEELGKLVRRYLVKERNGVPPNDGTASQWKRPNLLYG